MSEAATRVEFKRSSNHFTDRITADGRQGWPVEAGRYRLVVSRACPWASRAVTVRRLLGLEPAISLAVADPIQDQRSWRFTLDPGDVDPVLGIHFLGEAYAAREPGYAGGISVPAIVDVPSGKLVTNDYPQITLDLDTEWAAHVRPGAPDLYPVPLRDEIDEISQGIFEDVNNGVYRAGFATTQSAYESAFRDLFAALDTLDRRLGERRYLLGDRITEADWRLFTTLVRFDPVYVGHFKCNLRRIADYPNLAGYLRDLYQQPKVAETVNFNHIKRHYYRTHPTINPNRIVPVGPHMNLVAPHGREALATPG